MNKKIVSFVALLSLFSAPLTGCKKTTETTSSVSSVIGVPSTDAEKAVIYSYDKETKAYQVSGCKKDATAAVILPYYLDGGMLVRVTAIGEDAFSGCNNLVSVTIPDSITDIRKEAFCSCSSLSSLVLPKKLTTIGGGAFAYCRSLSSLQIPEAVDTIGNGAFQGCNKDFSLSVSDNNKNYKVVNDSLIDERTNTVIFGTSKAELTEDMGIKAIGALAYAFSDPFTTLTIPSTVKTIGAYAFAECSSLASITIPDSVTEIQSSTFINCSSLSSVSLPKGLGKIGDSAFSGCSSLASISLPNSIYSLGMGSFQGCTSLKSIALPKYVTEIPEQCFSTCSSLKSVSFSEDTERIDGAAFDNCYSLASIFFPEKVKAILTDAFMRCYALSSITVDPKNTAYKAENNCLIDIDAKTLILGCFNSVLPKDGSIEKIGPSAFMRLGITSVEIPKSVISIDTSAFFCCANLSSLSVEEGSNTYSSVSNCIIEKETKSLVLGCKSSVIPTDGSITRIGDNAFTGVSSSAVTIPEGVTAIGTRVFYSCPQLESLSLPSTLTTIGSNFCSSCPKLSSLQVKEGNTTFRSYQNGIIDIAKKSLILGCKNTILPTDNSVAVIGANAFQDCTGLTKLDIPESVKKIGGYAFSRCTSLVYMILPQGMESIDTFSFIGSSAKVYLKDTEETEGLHTFLKCPFVEVYFYSATRNLDGKHWHYKEDNVTPEVWTIKMVISFEKK
jgi:hypothetical protein